MELRPTPVRAQDYAHVSNLSAGDLVRLCAKEDPESKAADGELSLSACNSYILGAADALSVGKKFCLSSPAYSARVVTEVKRYLRASPKRAAMPPVSLIGEALAQAFPCERPRARR